MRNYDFIMVYEHKVREYETICLLRLELIRRGYSVFIINIGDRDMRHYVSKKTKYHCKVLLVPACYNNNTFKMCVGRVISFEKVIDLQWEQMISKSQEKENSYRNFSEIGKDVVHISWGKANAERLIKQAGILPQNVFLCGNMMLDLLREEFTEIYYSREEIVKQYGFNENGKICILFASFRGPDCSDKIIESYRRRYGEGRVRLQRIGKQTRDILLSWLCKAASVNKDDTYIYRPHPGEDTAYIENIIKGHTNIYIISDYSSRQWIKIADYLFSWHSTVLVEALYAGKIGYSLDPIEYMEEEDAVVFEGMNTIQSFERFIQILSGEKIDNNLERQKVEAYFGEIDGEYSFLRVADACEEVYYDDKYDLTGVVKQYDIYMFKNISLKEKIFFNPIVNWIYWKYMWVASKIEFMRRKENVKWYLKITESANKEIVSDEEELEIIKKLQLALCNVRRNEE